jgi:hypothetical protein
LDQQNQRNRHCLLGLSGLHHPECLVYLGYLARQWGQQRPEYLVYLSDQLDQQRLIQLLWGLLHQLGLLGQQHLERLVRQQNRLGLLHL